MQYLKLSTAATVTIGPILDSAGVEYTGAVIGDISIRKSDGTSSAALASAATLTHDANGYYKLVLTTGNTDTLGRLDFHCNKATYQCPQKCYMVLPATVYDALVTNATNTNGGFLAAAAATTVGAFVGNSTAAIVVDASGRVNSFLIGILTTVFTEGAAGRIAAAFKQFFNVASPASTMELITGTTNAPTAGDLTATMKSSVTAAVPTAAQNRAEMDANSTKLANLDATISSRLAAASYTAPPSAAANRAEMDANSAGLASIYARIGAPAGASVSADVAAVKSDTGGLVTTVGAAGAGLTAIPKTGYKLASDGLDAIAVTAPSGVAATFPGMVVQLWRRFFKRVTKDATQIKTYADDGATVVTTQSYTSSGSNDDVGAAS